MSSPFFKGLMILSKPKSKIVDVFCDKCNLSIYFGQNVLFYLQGGLQMPTSKLREDFGGCDDLRGSPVSDGSNFSQPESRQNIYGCFTEYLWNIYGISMNIIFGISMEYLYI